MLTQDNFVLVKTNSHNVVIIFVERHTLNVKLYIYGTNMNMNNEIKHTNFR